MTPMHTVLFVIEWPLIAGNFYLLSLTIRGQLAGFKNLGRVWYWTMLSDISICIDILGQNIYVESPVTRGINMLLALVWLGNAGLAYRSWVKHRDDDDDFPHQRLWKKIKSLVPSAQVAPAGV